MILRRLALIAMGVVLVACQPAAAPASPSPSPRIPTPSPTPAGHTLIGSLELHSTSTYLDCNGTDVYDDIRQGAQVVVTNESNTVIATGALQAGERLSGSVGCKFGFVIWQIPDAAFYGIEVSHRGKLSYSKAELESRGWIVAMILGNG